MYEVQSYILNISFPQSLEEILEIEHNVGKFDIEMLVDSMSMDIVNNWYAPKWIKPDDIVFFMHSKKLIKYIRHLKRLLREECHNYTSEDVDRLDKALARGERIYSLYGGKIFAVGRVDERPHYLETTDYAPHWAGRRYADVVDCSLFNNPIPLADFDPFIKLSCGGSITPVFGNEFVRLKALIASRNDIPEYLYESTAMVIPFRDINRENWFEVAIKYRRSFIYESQFREYYVNYLLKEIGDRKTIYRECACIKGQPQPSFVDNVILIGEKYLPVEVKLNINAEADIKGQVAKYCKLDTLYLDKKENKLAPSNKIYDSNVLIVDTGNIYMYYAYTGMIDAIYNLDDLVNIEGLSCIRQSVLNCLGE